jgi:hypothetical protein
MQVVIQPLANFGGWNTRLRKRSQRRAGNQSVAKHHYAVVAGPHDAIANLAPFGFVEI